jgi:hypothetical protein
MKAAALPRLARAALALALGLGEPAPFSVFELWPPGLFYLPVAFYWAWLALRFGSIGLPTAANPTIEAGGLCGESKSAVLALLGPAGRAHLARYTSMVLDAAAGGVAAETRRGQRAIARAGLAFPVVVKPDVSCKGTAVRVLRGSGDLARYVAAFPRGGRVILQELVDEEGEAGVFYVRRPREPVGRIVSLTLKYFPRVVGDGRSTLEELVLDDPRARRLAELYLARHPADRRRVLTRGEAFRLVFVGNHCKGAVFRDGRAHITPAMEAVFDRLAREIPEFHFGRFDVRFRALADLQNGTGFRIIEVNGAGSEATHIWDREARLVAAYRTLFDQLRMLFEIAAENRGRGFAPLTGLALLRMYLSQRRLMRAYPAGQ